MKIFQFAQKKFSLVGIGLHARAWNYRNVLSLSTFCVGIVSNGVYFFRQAKTFQDYTNSVFMATTLICSAAVLIIDVSNMQPIFGCVEGAEQIIDGSELEHVIVSL